MLRKAIVSSYCLLFLVVPLIWLPQSSELFEFNKLIVTLILTVLILGFWAARMIVEKRLIFHKTVVDLPLFVFLALSVISLLFSIDQHVSWFGYYSRWNGGVLSLLAYASLYWAAVSNLKQTDLKPIIISALTAAGIVSIYGIFEHFGYSLSCLVTTGNFDVACWVQDVQTRVFATLGQPNWLAAYVVSLLFIPLSKLTTTSSLKLKTLWFSVFCLLFSVLLFTKSRSGLLAFGIASVVYWLTNLKLKTENLKLTFLSFVLSCLLLVIIFPNPVRDILISPSTRPLAPSTGTVLETGGTESGKIRSIVWQGAIRAWLASPKNFFVGSGPETFAQIYYQHRPLEHNQTSEWELLYNKAHNEFLNQLTTTGILGFIAYIVLLGAMFYTFIKPQIINSKGQINDKMQNSNYKLNYNLDLQILNLGFFCGWLTLLVTNFWGFSVVITQILLFMLPAFAIILRTENLEQKTENKLGLKQLFAIFGLLFVSCYLLFAIGKYWYADYLYASSQRSFSYFQATQKPEYLISALQDIQGAVKYNLDEPSILSELAITSAYVGASLREANPALSGQLIQLSLDSIGRALQTAPQNPNLYKTQARVYILLSNIDQKYFDFAHAAFVKAAKLAPTDPRIPYNLAIIAKTQDATTSAKLYAEKALKLKPDFYDAANVLLK